MILYHAASSYYSMIGRYALYEADMDFESRRMDIHFAKEQISPWYTAINPAMTVPTLTDGQQSWLGSRDILAFAATHAQHAWLDADMALSTKIAAIVEAHYSLQIERLTFGKALTAIPPLRFLFPRMLRSIIKKLELELPNASNPSAIQAKIKLNQERLAYFTEGSRIDKLTIQRDQVSHFLNQLPTPGALLFGDKPSSADIVTVVLLGRLQMIGEYSLVRTQSPLAQWFERMQARSAYQKADIWTRFQPVRLLFHR